MIWYGCAGAAPGSSLQLMFLWRRSFVSQENTNIGEPNLSHVANIVNISTLSKNKYFCHLNPTELYQFRFPRYNTMSGSGDITATRLVSCSDGHGTTPKRLLVVVSTVLQWPIQKVMNKNTTSSTIFTATLWWNLHFVWLGAPHSFWV